MAENLENPFTSQNPAPSNNSQAITLGQEGTPEAQSEQDEYASWPVRLDMEARARKIRSILRIEAAVGQKPWKWLSEMDIRD